MNICEICQEEETPSRMCRKCASSYDRTAHREGTVLEAIVWAARRARRFERARARQGVRT